MLRQIRIVGGAKSLFDGIHHFEYDAQIAVPQLCFVVATVPICRRNALEIVHERRLLLTELLQHDVESRRSYAFGTLVSLRSQSAGMADRNDRDEAGHPPTGPNTEYRRRASREASRNRSDDRRDDRHAIMFAEMESTLSTETVPRMLICGCFRRSDAATCEIAMHLRR